MSGLCSYEPLTYFFVEGNICLLEGMINAPISLIKRYQPQPHLATLLRLMRHEVKKHTDGMGNQKSQSNYQ